MAPYFEKFEPREHPRVCFLGLGNINYSDDGFGVRLAGELARGGMPNVIIAGTAPEQYLGQVAAQNYDSLVFLDAVNFGGLPGSLVVLGAQQIQMRFPQISTHKISLAVLTKLVQSMGRTKVWLLGVQPESIREGRSMTPIVQATLELIKELLLDGYSCEEILEPAKQFQEMEEHVC